MFAGRGDVLSRQLTKTHMEKMSGTNIEGPPKVPKIDSSEHDGGLNFATKFIAFSLSVNFYFQLFCVLCK